MTSSTVCSQCVHTLTYTIKVTCKWACVDLLPGCLKPMIRLKLGLRAVGAYYMIPSVVPFTGFRDIYIPYASQTEKPFFLWCKHKNTVLLMPVILCFNLKYRTTSVLLHSANTTRLLFISMSFFFVSKERKKETKIDFLARTWSYS